jgi:hypothetical protein
VEVYALAQEDAAQLLELSGSGETRHEAVLALARANKARLETLMCCGDLSGQRAVVEAVDEVRYGAEYESGMPQFPRAFETRNAGDTVEFEPTVSADGRLCDLNMVLQRVQLRGILPVYAHQPTPIAQAQFLSAKFTSSMTLDVGLMEFLGSLSRPPQSEPAAGQEVRLAFGRIDSIDVGTDSLHVNPWAKPSLAAANVELTVTYYSLDREMARQILGRDLDGENCYDAVKVLAGKNQAKLERLAVIKTKSGQRAVVQEADEVRYPAGYSLLTGSGGANAASQPNTFETRNCGLTVEVEPTVGPSGKVLNLDIVPQVVSYLGDLQGGPQPLPQPLFATRKLTTSINIPIGGHALLGTASDPGADGVNGRKDTGRTWLCFVQAKL